VSEAHARLFFHDDEIAHQKKLATATENFAVYGCNNGQRAALDGGEGGTISEYGGGAGRVGGEFAELFEITAGEKYVASGGKHDAVYGRVCRSRLECPEQ